MTRFVNLKVVAGGALLAVIGTSGAILAAAQGNGASQPTGAETLAQITGQAVTGPQAEALADGVVTHEEIEAATALTVTCMEDAGLDVLVEPGEGLRPTRFGFKAATLTDAEAAKGVMDRCRHAHLSALEVAWAFQHAPATPDDREAGLRLLAECMDGRGADVGEVVTGEMIREWTVGPDAFASDEARAWLACGKELEPVLGYMPG